MPPPSPRRSTSTGETQTTPLQNNIQDQRVQGQPDHNHIGEDPLANITGSNTSKGKRNRKKSTHEVPPRPGTSGGFAGPRTDFISRNLGTGRPTIQCTACREYSHWRRECPYDNFCTTCNNHNHATHMCRAPKDTPQQNPAMCVYCGITEYSSVQCHNRCILPEATRDQAFQHTNSKILGKAGFQSTNNQRGASQPHAHRSYNEILGSTGSYQPNNHNSQSSRGNQNYSSRCPAREQHCYDNNSNSSFRNYGHQLRGPTQSHARFDERYNHQYSPPIYPPTPSLNTSFPEALSLYCRLWRISPGLLRP